MVKIYNMFLVVTTQRAVKINQRNTVKKKNHINLDYLGFNVIFFIKYFCNQFDYSSRKWGVFICLPYEKYIDLKLIH